MSAKMKRLDGFHVPLDEIKEKVRRNLDDWKKQNSSIHGDRAVCRNMPDAGCLVSIPW